MWGHPERRHMEAETRRWVELAALQLALVVVAAHLYAGLVDLVDRLRYGFHGDPFPLLLVLSSAAVIGGVAYVGLGGRREPVYALGIALMLVHFFGFWAYHQVGHLPAMPWVDAAAEPHGRGPVETLVLHLGEDPVALVAKLGELALAGVLGLLLVDLRRGGDA